MKIFFTLFITTFFAVESFAASPRTTAGGARGGLNIYQQMEIYRQNFELQQQMANEITTQNISPVEIADENLRAAVESGSADEQTISELEQCSAIYPGGIFEWARPTGGSRANADYTCIARVELRKQRNEDDRHIIGEESEIVLATAFVAAGDSIKCNIDNFPKDSYLPAAGEVLFPANRAPTLAEVQAIMDEEQKRGLGIKIAANALMGGVLGNISGKNDAGNDAMFGADRGKVKGTVVGILGGGAVGAASGAFGKVGGDVIQSAAMNAAMGSMIGNIMTPGKEKLHITTCKDLAGNEVSCLFGIIEESLALDTTLGTPYFDYQSGATVQCLDDKPCVNKRFNNMTLDANTYGFKTVAEARDKDSFQKIKSLTGGKFSKDSSGIMREDTNGTFIKLSSAGISGTSIPVAITGIEDKMTGWNVADWNKVRNNYRNNVYQRNAGGALSTLDKKHKFENFIPSVLDGSEGGIIDMDNRARIGGTLIGGAAGGGMGAFTAVQNAKTQVEERWVAEEANYEGYREQFYCATGTRFLVFYNEDVIIPGIDN